MSNNIANIKSDLKDLQEVTQDLSEDELQFIKARDRFNELSPKDKARYLKIYQYYVKGDRTILQTAKSFKTSIQTIKNALDLIGDQLIIFTRNKNVIVPQLALIRYRKQDLQKDIGKLSFSSDMTVKDQYTAKIKIRYLEELRKLDELEDKLLGLLEQKIEIDQSKKSFTVISHFEKPEPDSVVTPARVIKNAELLQ